MGCVHVFMQAKTNGIFFKDFTICVNQDGLAFKTCVVIIKWWIYLVKTTNNFRTFMMFGL
jgi:hypothetical protein